MQTHPVVKRLSSGFLVLLLAFLLSIYLSYPSSYPTIVPRGLDIQFSETGEDHGTFYGSLDQPTEGSSLNLTAPISSYAISKIAIPFGEPAQFIPAIRKRTPIDPVAWQKKVTKGHDEIFCSFGRPIENVPQSQWLKWQSITDWGWQEADWTSMYESMGMTNFNDLMDLQGFLQENGYGMNPTADGWEARAMAHESGPYTPPGSTTQKQETGGAMTGFYNLADRSKGVYVVATMYSPRYKASKIEGFDMVNGLPDLQRWSDVVALEWFHESGGAVDGSGTVAAPRFIVIPQIIAGSTDTQQTIDYALQLVGKSLVPWPGVEFTPETTEEAFYGLLGTAHAQGPSYLLIQHKAWFGNKKIDKITIWATEPKPGNFIYNMLVSIVDS